MIKCNLSVLMGAKKMNIQDVCNVTGLARNTVTNLYKENASRVDYNTMEKLCEALDCTIGELWSYERETGDTN